MASRGVNKVIIIGRLGHDPEIRYSPSGTAFANLTVATSEQWRDKQTGEQKEQTEWHRVVMSGKLAEIASEYLRKGSEVYLEGKLRTRKWQVKADRIGSLPKSSWALVEPCKCLVASKEAMNSLHLSEITVSNKDSNLSSKGITANHLWILTTISPLHQ